MKWKREAPGHYISEDGTAWIHRYWPKPGDEAQMRTYWDVCFLDYYQEWVCVNTVRTLAVAKQWAEDNNNND